MRGRKEPLYRKVNTRTHNVHHGGGKGYRWARRTGQPEGRASETSMASGRNGLDYTPLFRFLLSKIGQEWAAVHSEAVARLDREEPIWWMVARNPAEEREYIRISESSYYSGLKIDEDGKLALVDPALRNEDLEPSCPCCTHSFNGKPFVNRFRAT